MHELSERTKLLLEGSIAPSPNSIDLSHSATSDFLNRHLRKTPHVAELYHENSKVNPHSTLLIPGDDSLLLEVREWFFDTAYSSVDDTLIDNETGLRLLHEDMSVLMKDLLSSFFVPGPVTNLLFAVDLLVMYQDSLYRVVPQSEYLWIEKTLGLMDIQNILISSSVSDQDLGDGLMLFVVACPWRYMLLYGPRGYRHTLMDIGRLLGYFENRTSSSDYHISITQNFHDTAIDNSVSVDGLERSVYAIVHVEFKHE